MMLKKMYYLPGLVVVFASLLVSDALAGQDAAAPKSDGKSAAGSARIAVRIDKTEYGQEATVKITGKAPKGKPVFIEVASEKTVAVRRLDSKRDKETGKIPYIFYTSEDVPAYYVTLIPKGMSDKVEALKAQKDEWSYSGALRTWASTRPACVPRRPRSSGGRPPSLPSLPVPVESSWSPLDEKGNVKSVLPLYKSRFKSPARLLKPVVDAKPDGSFEASLKLPKGIADGTYTVTAFTDKAAKTATSFTMVLPAGTWYFKRAGMAMNIFGPFIMALLVTMLGVLMGAGGGFILTPLLLWVYGLPHTIAAGTVLPTVLFSQMSGIYNYNKIKFISWKLGLTMGAAMLAGGFIGPVITQLISLSQYKSWFGGVLVILAGLMLWQTLPAQMGRGTSTSRRY